MYMKQVLYIKRVFVCQLKYPFSLFFAMAIKSEWIRRRRGEGGDSNTGMRFKDHPLFTRYSK